MLHLLGGDLLGTVIVPPIYLAVSGGVDSMVLLDFFLRGKKPVVPCFFDHGTETSKKAKEFLLSRIPELKVPYPGKWPKLELTIGTIQKEKEKDQSWEEYWRIERHNFFKQLPHHHVVTAHHLDDAVETWLWGAMHGQPKLMDYDNGLVMRPLLLTTKAEIISYAKKNKVKYIVDESNDDTSFSRNLIRKEIIPLALKVNPGIHKVIARKIKEKYEKVNQEQREVMGEFLQACLDEDNERALEDDEETKNG